MPESYEQQTQEQKKQEKLRKIKKILLISIIITIFWDLLSVSITWSISSPYGTSILIRLVIVVVTILNFWTLGYGLRYIFFVLRYKLFDLSFFLIVIFWLVVMIPIFYGFYEVIILGNRPATSILDL